MIYLESDERGFKVSNSSRTLFHTRNYAAAQRCAQQWAVRGRDWVAILNSPLLIVDSGVILLGSSGLPARRKVEDRRQRREQEK